MTNTFKNATLNQEARTANGMKARQGTANSCVDLFFKAGAMRGQDIVPVFAAAYAEDKEMAIRIALWLRDAREGAGERKLFRDILGWLEVNDEEMAGRMLPRIPELGRWDDLLGLKTDLKYRAYDIVGKAIVDKNGLAAKWMPRKGPIASDMRKYFRVSPKQWRKDLVSLTKVVETQMCANEWDDIDYNVVPSVASARYKKAFARHSPENYGNWAKALVSDDPAVRATVKVNAGAVYPYDVVKNLKYASASEVKVIKAQWDALPNYVGDSNILPMVDVSGSMGCPVGGYGSGNSMTCMEVAVSLGMYCADKNTGKFKDMVLTFSVNPELYELNGDIATKYTQISRMEWGYNTNLHAAFDKVLDVAVKGNVPQEEMPSAVLIMSDMQFDSCVSFDDGALAMISRKYADAGYKMPAVVFWNINAADNVPVKFDQKGVALVSGFSPAIMTSVLAADFDEMTPEGIMTTTVNKSRYDLPSSVLPMSMKVR